MNRGLLARAWRESWPVTLLFGLGLAWAQGVNAYVLLTFQDQLTAAFSQLALLQTLVKTFVGANLAGQLSPQMLPAIAWAHPVVLALVWAHAVTYCTRVPAGEVDRGTIDVLLGLPVSRWRLYAAESFVWLLSGTAVILLGAAGNTIGQLMAGSTVDIPPAVIFAGHVATGHSMGPLTSHGSRVDFCRQAMLATNLLCLYAAVGGLAWFVSTLSDRRGRAVGVTFAFVLGLFLLNYLAPFWSLAERLSFLSLLHYYVPLRILQEGAWPAGDMLVLVGFAAVLWAAGGMVFARRDLSTV